MSLTCIILCLLAVWPRWLVAGDGDTTDVHSSEQVAADHALGRTVSGHRCLASCAAGGGHCYSFAFWRNQTLEPCWYLMYYTAQRMQDLPLCSGPCVSFERGYRCAVNATAMDWCNPRSHHELVYEARTLVGGERCADACTADAVGVHVCRKPSGEHAACEPRALHYFRAHTTSDQPCADSCMKRDGQRRGLRCKTADDTLTLCAPPARFYMRATTNPPPV